MHADANKNKKIHTGYKCSNVQPQKGMGITMIKLTNLKQKEFILNADLIMTIEDMPDTKVTLTNGKVFVVKETVSQVVEKATAYYRSIYSRR